MKNQSLSDIYSSLGIMNATVYVVPKIRADFPASDYLYLLYEQLIKDDKYHIKSRRISVCLRR